MIAQDMEPVRKLAKLLRNAGDTADVLADAAENAETTEEQLDAAAAKLFAALLKIQTVQNEL